MMQKKYTVTVNDKQYQVISYASEWFVKTSVLSHIPDNIESWNISWEKHSS
jgi:hypothetical protein